MRFQIVLAFLLGLTPLVSATAEANAPACKTEVSVLDPLFSQVYVAKGDGKTDDTRAIQNVLDYNVCTKGMVGGIQCKKTCPSPMVVIFPAPLVSYRVSTLKLHPNMILMGSGRQTRGIEGDGSGPAILADNLVTNFTLLRMTVANTKYPSIQITNRSSDFNLLDSSFVSFALETGGTNAIQMSQSYRGNIERCVVGQIGPGWAISAMDNSNSLTISDSIIRGSTAGNGIDIGQSQGVRIQNNTLENMPGYGIRVAANVAGGGVSTALVITGNYFEDISKPISLGEANQVAGATVSSNYISNYACPVDGNGKPTSPNTCMTERHYFIYLGRVTASAVTNNVYSGGGKEPFILFGYVRDPERRPTVPEFADDCKIEKNNIRKVGSFYELQNFPVGGTHRLERKGGISHQDYLLAINSMSFVGESRAH